ncbi:MAG: hypothetical protein PHR77_00905 [Kiritimatiellae bacterium]|nr:hypothetical protein [Kiritimatiellia bacterium]MDD5519290.1 hypothetical protein [Kiritimatiellia bacterium]
MKYVIAVMTMILVFRAEAGLSSTNGVWFDAKHTDGKSLFVRSGDYTMRFAEKSSWTFREASYRGKQFLTTSGWQQPVLNEAKVPKGKDTFLGTGHRREAVESIAVTVSNASESVLTYPVVEGLSITNGDMFIIEKKSKFISEFSGLLYEHRSWVTVSPDGIHERYWFRAAGEGTTNVNYMYVFMHIFRNSTKQWIVGDDKGEITKGEFIDDMSFSLKKDIRWAFIYDPMEIVGVVYVYPKIYEGKRGFKNSFWNRSYDNKLYLQIDPKRKMGEEFEYEVTLKVFIAPAEIWETEAKKTLTLFLR